MLRVIDPLAVSRGSKQSISCFGQRRKAAARESHESALSRLHNVERLEARLDRDSGDGTSVSTDRDFGERHLRADSLESVLVGSILASGIRDNDSLPGILLDHDVDLVDNAGVGSDEMLAQNQTELLNR